MNDLAEIDRIVDLLRSGDYKEAASRFNAWSTVLRDYLVTGAMQRMPIREKIVFSLQTLLLMIEQKNWIAVADILEYELCDLLKKSRQPDDQTY